MLTEISDVVVKRFFEKLDAIESTLHEQYKRILKEHKSFDYDIVIAAYFELERRGILGEKN